jgi:hypothetical protein
LFGAADRDDHGRLARGDLRAQLGPGKVLQLHGGQGLRAGHLRQQEQQQKGEELSTRKARIRFVHETTVIEKRYREQWDSGMRCARPDIRTAHLQVHIPSATQAPAPALADLCTIAWVSSLRYGARLLS